MDKLQIPVAEEYVINPEKIPDITLPRPPKALLDILEKDGVESQKEILKIREKILKFDERIGETTTAVTIAYGKKRGKSISKSPQTRCAEFHREETTNWISSENKLDKSNVKVLVRTTDFYGKPLSQPEYDYYQTITNIELFLYLPFPKDNTNQRIIKVLIKTDNWLNVSKIVIPSRYKQPWRAGGYWNLEKYLKIYEKLTGKIVTCNSLDTLVDIALEEWRKRQ